MYCLLSFCCVCLNDREELQSLSNTDVDNVQLLDKLNFCAFENEWIQSNFPIFICYKCCHNLRIAYEFKKMCHKNNKLLRGYVHQLNFSESLDSNLHATNFRTLLKEAKQPGLDAKKLVQDTVIAQYCKTELDFSPGAGRNLQDPPDQDGDEDLAVNAPNTPNSGYLADEAPARSAAFLSDKAPGRSAAYFLQDNLRSGGCLGAKAPPRGPSGPGEVLKEDDLNLLGYPENYFQQAVADGPKQCPLCSRTFSQKAHLEKHLVTHAAKKPHTCSVCNKTFSRKLHLERHLLTHSGKRSHHCSLCSKSFILKSHLNGHMLTHTGIKSHHCTLCSKNFARKSDLHRHMLIHTVERSYSCSFCNKSFARKSHLGRHMIFHSGKRPHHCSLCSKSFILKSHLNDHMLTHTGVKSHHCTMCVKSFGRKSDLNRHMLTHSADRANNYAL